MIDHECRCDFVNSKEFKNGKQNGQKELEIADKYRTMKMNNPIYIQEII